MSTNKKFRIQNGVDITGEVVVGNQLVITAEGKLVLPAITEAVNEAVATDIAALQAQVDAILGTSPEHLDTLQEIVALFQSEDGDIQTLITNNSTAITQIQQTLASGVATAAQGALADTAAQQADLDAVIAQITDGVATAAQGALADTAVQPEDLAALEAKTSGISYDSGSSNIDMESTLDMKNNPIVNVPLPVSDTDVATKAYVDSGVAGVDLSGYTETSGMTSAIATAKSEAISTAAADATAKADQAETDAKAYADQVVAATVDAAPAALDTLNELAAALGDDANFASTVTTSLATKVGLSEVETVMQPVKELAESAVQPEDFGVGILTVSTTASDLSVQPSVSSAVVSGNTEFFGNPGTYREDTFVTNGTVSAITSGAGVTIFDTTTGDQLHFFQGSSSLGHSGSYISKALAINSTTLFVVTYMTTGGANNAKLHRINLSDGTYQSSTISTDLGGMPFDLALRGNYLYLSAGGPKDAQHNRSNSSVLTFDITTGNQTNTATKDNGQPTLWGNSIAIDGNVLVVADNGSGRICGVNIPDGWETSGSTNFIYEIQKPAGLNFAYRVETSDGKIYVYSETSGWPATQIGHIHVYDVTDGSLITSYSSETSSLDFGADFSVMGTALLVSETNGDVATRYLLDLSTDLRYEITESFGTDKNGRFTNDGTSFYAVGGDGDNRVYTTVSPSGSTSHEHSVDTSVIATKDYVDSGVAGVDLSAYSTTAEMDVAIAAIPATDLTPYSTTAEMDSAIAVETAARETAVTSAISTAAADATSKADAAQAAAIAAAGTAATQAIADTIDAAPASLDTLNELAAALGDDANFASTVTASIATKADDAATTAALASKVGLAEVDVRMEPIKQTAESAIQPSDLGTGIAEVSSSVVDWSSLTSEDFAAISDTSGLYSVDRGVLAVDATDTHFVTLQYNNDSGDTSDSYRELVISVHLLDGTLVKSFQATEDFPELNLTWLSHLSINGNYISLSRMSATGEDTEGYGKIFDIRNIDQADHGLVKTINENNLRRLFTIDDTRAIAVYAATYNNIDTVKVHNISDWSELYSFDPAGTPDEADFGGGYFVTGGVSGNTNQGITILSTSGSYGLTGIVYNSYMHGPSNNTAMFANGITVSDKYVVFRTQDTDGTNRAHVHSPVDGSYIRSFVEESSTPWQVLNNSKGLGKVALALSGDVLFIPLADYTHSAPYNLKKGVAVYNILTGELLNELTMFDGSRYSGGGAYSLENLYNVYTVGGSTIIDINEEMYDAGSISPRIATAPTTSVLSYGVDTSVFATKDYVDSGVAGVDLSAIQSQITATDARTTGIDVDSDGNIELSVGIEMGQNNIKDVNDVYAARGFIDTIESNDLKVQTGTVDFEGSIVNFGSSTITGGGFGNATKAEIDQHLNVSAADSGEFLKWNGTDYEFTDYIQGRIASNQILVEGTLKVEQPGSTIDWQDGLVHFGGSQVIVDEPTAPNLAANKEYVDSVVAEAVDAAIQPEDFGTGITTSSQTLVDWSSDSVLQTPATIAAPSSVTSDAWAYGTIIANNSTKWATNDWLHDGDKGRVYVFNQSDNSLAFTLDGTSSGERMGSIGLVMNDQYIVAGAYNYNGQQGRVHVFSAVDGSPLHIFEPDNVPNPWNQFKGRFGGRGLALEGSNLYVGTTEHITIGDGNVDGQSEAGAVYYFDLSTGNKVSRIENPIAEGYYNNRWFGREISVHGNNVYISYGSSNGGLHHYTLSDSTLTLQNSFAFSGISGIGDGSSSQFGQQTDTNGTYFIAYAPFNQSVSGEFGVIVYKNEDLHNGVFEPVYNIDTTHASGGLLFIDGNTIAAGVGSSSSIQIYTLGDTLSEVVTGQTLSVNVFSDEGTTGGAKPFAYLSDSSKFLYRTPQSTTDIGVYDVVSSSTSSYVVDDSVFATKDYVDSGIAGVDLSSYSTTVQMDSAIDAEVTRATGAESGLQNQISNILSNTDATALNSLAEIVTEFQNADSTLTGVVGGHGTRLTDLEGRTTDNIPEGINNKYYSDDLVKTALTGGLCINDTKLQATGEIAVDEVEAESSLRVAEAVVSDDTVKLEGQGGSHYRIDIYDVNGTIVN